MSQTKSQPLGIVAGFAFQQADVIGVEDKHLNACLFVLSGLSGRAVSGGAILDIAVLVPSPSRNQGHQQKRRKFLLPTHHPSRHSFVTD